VRKIKRIGILTGGGDCSGLNAVIRSATKTAILKYEIEVIGIKYGYRGLFLGGENFINLDLPTVSGLLPTGGTILFSSNKDNLFDYTYEENGITKHGDVSHVGIENLKKAGIDALVVVGGDGTLTSALDFYKKGVNVVGVPKTIDNDLSSTDTTFGFDTAVHVATESIDRLRTTARSHSRIIVVEVMGRYAGWIALDSGIAGGVDVILIPEIPYDIDVVIKHLKTNLQRGKDNAIVVVSEGAKSIGGEVVVSRIVENSPDPIRLGGIGNIVAEKLEDAVGLESRVTVLGHVQRGGIPTANDRILSTRYGSAAIELVMEEKFGNMVVLLGNEMSSAPFEEVINKNKFVNPKGEIVETAKSVGICFGSAEE
jgi:6-phosphofructokinase 1